MHGLTSSNPGTYWVRMKLERMEAPKLVTCYKCMRSNGFGNKTSSAGGGLPRSSSKLYERNQLSSADNCKVRPRSNLGGYAVAGGVVSRIHALRLRTRYHIFSLLRTRQSCSQLLKINLNEESKLFGNPKEGPCSPRLQRSKDFV